MGETDRDLVVGLTHRRRIAHRDANDLTPLDETLGPQEPDRQLVLEAGRAQRDRDCDRVLAGSGGADLERLLADDAIGPELEGLAADGDDPGGRHLAGRRGEGLGAHCASVGEA